MKYSFNRQELLLKKEKANNAVLADAFGWFIQDVLEEVDGFTESSGDFEKGLQMGYFQVCDMLKNRLDTMSEIYNNEPYGD